MKIICIGRNYSDHAKELHNPIPEKPVFFLKPDSAILLNNRTFYIPEFSNNIQYEAELVVKIHRIGKHIQEEFSHRYYNEIGLGIDFTARDVQQECKEKGLPWEIAKAFDMSAPLGEFIKLEKLQNRQAIDFELIKNGKLVQKGNSADMLFSIDKIIAYISQFLTLKIGDLIFTGTPAGVGKVEIGDKLEGKIEGKTVLNLDVR